ncbi:hypothetical protein H696_04062 [Fonticula alba]|uniref:PCI domain-containing protein n=1 Tax=Fonticula alba TaxID=691883 RepID=A0A058Z699_FONAL|nr:hypothetical protein H696_04062 [Fonticula alba]KCV69646.1 hypothetical protein H696_04062 [Fonticula alba]|eukprot:XP_009496211.1 hypothetical protein H696_04062 [Fonticula alba]
MSVLPEQISQLETSVAAQFSGAQEYNLSEMMNLLKFYNFDPVEVGTEAAKARGLIVARIIIKSLTVSPRADAAAACYLLSATLLEDENVQAALTLQEQFECIRLDAFWASVAKPAVAALIEPVVGFFDNIRDVIAGVVSITYQRLSLSLFGTLVNLSGAELTQFISSKGWTVEGDVLSLPLVPENTSSDGSVVSDNIQLPQLTKLITYASTSN